VSKGTVYGAVAVHRAACIKCRKRSIKKKGNVEVFKLPAVYGAAAVHGPHVCVVVVELAVYGAAVVHETTL